MIVQDEAHVVFMDIGPNRINIITVKITYKIKTSFSDFLDTHFEYIRVFLTKEIIILFLIIVNNVANYKKRIYCN